MYEDYWQLESKPFGPATREADYFPGETHQGALLKLRYAIDQRRTAAVLAGPGGVGKSLLVERLLNELGPEISPVARVVFPQMSDRDLLSYLADRLGAPTDHAPQHTVDESIRRIERLFADNQETGRHALLVIDEAHLLEDTGLLETVRLLLNLGPTLESPATILLVGQLGLLSSLQRTPALDDRVAVKSLLQSFTVEQTREYVQHRLSAAGAGRDIFSTEAVEMLHALTGGVPRRIDRLGDLALVVGFADGRPTIDPEHLESVNRELLAASPE